VEAVRGFGWGPALGGHGCGHGFEDGAWGFAEGQDQVRSRCIATRERQAHLETAEAAFRVCLGGEDHYDRCVEEAVEQALREVVAIVDGGGVEEGKVSEFCG
jgi:hypothetical protein